MEQFATLNELVEFLSEMAEAVLDDGTEVGDLPVAIAHQKSWPLAEALEAVTVCTYEGEKKVWLAASPSYGYDYAPNAAWNNGIEGCDWMAEEE